MPENKSDGKESFFSDFFDDYFSEVDEHLSSIKKKLLSVEEFVNKSDIDKELLNSILRSYHTIKGLSGMIGLKEAEKLSHQMEHYLRALHDKKTILSNEGLNQLIKGTSLLEQIIKSKKMSRNIPQPDEFINSFEKIIGTPEQIKSEKTSKDMPQERTEDHLKENEESKLKEAIKEGKNIWIFTFTPSHFLSDRGINVNTARDKLQSVGEIISAIPKIKPDGNISFEFIISSNADENIFKSWLNEGLEWTKYEYKSEIEENPPYEETDRSSIPQQQVSQRHIVRVGLDKLDDLMRITGDLVITRSRLEDTLLSLKHKIPEEDFERLKDTHYTFEIQLRTLRESIMRTRLMPISEVFQKMQFVVKDLIRENKKQIKVLTSGEETEIDKLIVERMMDPLLHLVRNSVSHGIETPEERVKKGKQSEGTIYLKAHSEGENIVIEIEDDGKGIDEEKVISAATEKGLIKENTPKNTSTILDLICMPGFSTRNEADMTSGRGVGMSVVKNTLQELGGSLSLDNRPGQGARFILQLPLTLSIVDAMVIKTGDHFFTVPQPTIKEIIEINPSDITIFENNEIIPYRDNILTLIRLSNFFGIKDNPVKKMYALIVSGTNNFVGILVDKIAGRREIVVRPVTDPLIKVPGISGATELGDGKAVLILDIHEIAQKAKYIMQYKKQQRTDHRK